MNNVVEDIIKELAEVSEEVCDYACKWKEQYKDPDELIDKRCEYCPIMKLIY